MTAANEVLTNYGGYSAEAQADFDARLVKLGVDPKAKEYLHDFIVHLVAQPGQLQRIRPHRGRTSRCQWLALKRLAAGHRRGALYLLCAGLAVQPDCRRLVRLGQKQAQAL